MHADQFGHRTPPPIFHQPAGRPCRGKRSSECLASALALLLFRSVPSTLRPDVRCGELIPRQHSPQANKAAGTGSPPPVCTQSHRRTAQRERERESDRQTPIGRGSRRQDGKQIAWIHACVVRVAPNLSRGAKRSTRDNAAARVDVACVCVCRASEHACMACCRFARNPCRGARKNVFLQQQGLVQPMQDRARSSLAAGVVEAARSSPQPGSV